MENKTASNDPRPASKETLGAGIFIGFQINSEVAYELSKSPDWKEANITRHTCPNEIQEIVFRDKKYIGRYIQKTKITMKEIEAEEMLIRSRLCDFIPETKAEALHLQIITQLFLY